MYRSVNYGIYKMYVLDLFCCFIKMFGSFDFGISWNSLFFRMCFLLNKKNIAKVLCFVSMLITLFAVIYVILVQFRNHCLFCCVELCNIGLYVAITILCLRLL